MKELALEVLFGVSILGLLAIVCVLLAGAM